MPDDLIDRAARELTQGEPSPQLRQQVRARIGRPRGYSLPAMVPAVAALVAIVVAGVLMQQSAWKVALPEPPRVALGPVESLDPVIIGAAPDRPERDGRTVRADQPASLRIAPLTIEPIAMPLMAVTTSSGTPIEIDDLRIEPLQIQ